MGARGQLRRHHLADAARLRPPRPPSQRDRHVRARDRDARGGRGRQGGAAAPGRGHDHLGRRGRRRSGLSTRDERAGFLPLRHAGVLRAANDALDRTPDQLPVLKEAGVVDSGGAGFRVLPRGHSHVSSRRESSRDRVSAPAGRVRASSRQRSTSARTNTAPSSSLEDATCPRARAARRARTARRIAARDRRAADDQSAHSHRRSRARARDRRPTRHAHASESRQHGAAAHRARRREARRRPFDRRASCRAPASNASCASSAPKSSCRARRTRACAICCSPSTRPRATTSYLFVNDKNVALAAARSRQADRQARARHSDAPTSSRASRGSSRCAASTDGADRRCRYARRCGARRTAPRFSLPARTRRWAASSVARGKPAAAYAAQLVGGDTLAEVASKRRLRSMGAAERRPDHALLRRRAKGKGRAALQRRAGSGFSGRRRRILLRRYEERGILDVAR